MSVHWQAQNANEYSCKKEEEKKKKKEYKEEDYEKEEKERKEEVTVRRAEYDLQQQILYSPHRQSLECISYAYLSLFVLCHWNKLKRIELEEKDLSGSLSHQ